MKSGFPTGTVTFLFTDIQGTTRLWQEKPAEMSIAHARHNAILRTAIEASRGYVFQVIGDAFCAAFHTAGDALRAVVKAQKDLPIDQEQYKGHQLLLRVSNKARNASMTETEREQLQLETHVESGMATSKLSHVAIDRVYRGSA